VFSDDTYYSGNELPLVFEKRFMVPDLSFDIVRQGTGQFVAPLLSG
jgi:hypothetical protein